jgi:hypothetical protein
MKVVASFILFFITSSSFAQMKVTKLAVTAIPKNIKYAGKVRDAVQWVDSLGNNIVITTETGETKSKVEPDSRDAALYALHYITQADSMKLIWKFQDYVKDCPVDIEANYIANTFAITDLNKNGKAEIWLMYKTSCRGDVSPSDMKIMMYEGDKKYAVRGRNKIKISETDFEGGEYKLDEAFKNSPDVFQKYAKQLWEKNKIQN